MYRVRSNDHIRPQFSTSLETIPQPAFLYGANRRIIEANGPAEALAGCALAGAYAATVVGIFRIRQPDGSPVVLPELPAIRALAGEEVADYPVAITTVDGQSRLIFVSASPIQEGESVVGALSIWFPASTRDSV